MTILDEYADDEAAALYDLQYDGYDDDLGLYEGFAHRSNTAALELMAGSGRVALHLARNGCDVVCVDSSPGMLSRLRSKPDAAAQNRLRILEADARDFDLGETFDLIYIALCSFEIFHAAADQLAVLENIAKHLAPGGVFVAELRSLTAIDWSQEPSALRLEWHRTDPATGEYITKLHSATSSRARQMTLDTIVFDRLRKDGSVRRRVMEVALRAFGRYEFELMLERAGLRLKDIYGDAGLSPYDDSSDSMIIVAEAAETGN